MRLDELRVREDADVILRRTLASGWSELLGQHVQVLDHPAPDAQLWLVHPVLSVVYVPGVASVVRRFVADSVRFTARLRRMVPQWAAGTVLASGPLMRLAGRPFAWVRPAIPDSEHQLVLPGNRRIRFFDLRTRRTRAVRKEGFSAACIATEIRVRGGLVGPFVTIDAWADDRWFEEPLVPGFDLARCPPWRPRSRYRQRALDALRAWQLPSVRTVPAEVHAEALLGRCAAGLAAICALDDGIGRDLLQRAEALALGLSHGEATLAGSHGDLQPGNVLVAASEQVCLVDWEYSRERVHTYDLLGFALSTRSPEGLAARSASFLSGTGLPRDVQDRLSMYDPRRALAWQLLEEIAWVGDEATSGPFRAVSMAARHLHRELAKIEPERLVSR